jgi:hypothetical protein
MITLEEEEREFKDGKNLLSVGSTNHPGREARRGGEEIHDDIPFRLNYAKNVQLVTVEKGMSIKYNKVLAQPTYNGKTQTFFLHSSLYFNDRKAHSN